MKSCPVTLGGGLRCRAPQCIQRYLIECVLLCRANRQAALTVGGHIFFQTLSAAATLGIFLTDATGLRTYHNSRWMQIAGLSLEASLGTGWVNAIHPDDRQSTIASWQQNVAEGQEWYHAHRILTPGGDVRWVHAMASPIRDASRITGFAGTVEDISSRREVDERLRESNQRLRALAAHSQQALADAQSRLSREIHDPLGQSLPAPKMDTGWLSRPLGGQLRGEP